MRANNGITYATKGREKRTTVLLQEGDDNIGSAVVVSSISCIIYHPTAGIGREKLSRLALVLRFYLYHLYKATKKVGS